MVITLHLCVLYGLQNKRSYLPYTSLTDWFLQPKWRVFNARYGLSPYITQICLILKGLMMNLTSVLTTPEQCYWFQVDYNML
jgi:hypothetical protein